MEHADSERDARRMPRLRSLITPDADLGSAGAAGRRRSRRSRGRCGFTQRPVSLAWIMIALLGPLSIASAVTGRAFADPITSITPPDPELLRATQSVLLRLHQDREAGRDVRSEAEAVLDNLTPFLHHVPHDPAHERVSTWSMAGLAAVMAQDRTIARAAYAALGRSGVDGAAALLPAPGEEASNHLRVGDVRGLILQILPREECEQAVTARSELVGFLERHAIDLERPTSVRDVSLFVEQFVSNIGTTMDHEAARAWMRSTQWGGDGYSQCRAGSEVGGPHAIDWYLLAIEDGWDEAWLFAAEAYVDGRRDPSIALRYQQLLGCESEAAREASARALARRAMVNGDDGVAILLTRLLDKGDFWDLPDYIATREQMVAVAEAGNVAAMLSLAADFVAGKKFPPDDVQAAYWFERVLETDTASARERTDALLGLGKIHYTGRGVPNDDARAAEYFQRAIDDGNSAYAMALLGDLYSMGRGVPRDRSRAEQLWQQASTRLGAWGTSTLVWDYERGRGLPVDEALSIAWDRRSIALDGDQGKWSLGKRYAEGRGVPVDADIATEYLSAAIAGGAHWSMLDLALLYARGEALPPCPELSRHWFEEIERLGNTETMTDAAVAILADDRLHAERDRAVRMLIEAAKRGYNEAMLNLGKVYLEGRVVPRDLRRGEAWLRQAVASDGFGPEHLNVARIYAAGEIIERNDAKAIEYYRLALSQGHRVQHPEDAAFELGMLYAEGRGGPEHIGLGKRLINVAARAGSTAAWRHLGWVGE